MYFVCDALNTEFLLNLYGPINITLSATLTFPIYVLFQSYTRDILPLKGRLTFGGMDYSNPWDCYFSVALLSFQRELRCLWLPPWPSLRVSSPVDVTTAKAAGVEQCLTSLTLPRSAAVEMKAGVTAVRREAETFGLDTSLQMSGDGNGGGTLHEASGDARGNRFRDRIVAI